MNREDIEQAIYERTRRFVSEDVQDAILELIAAERQWVGLTPHERMMCRSYDIDTAIDKTEAKLKEKNT